MQLHVHSVGTCAGYEPLELFSHPFTLADELIFSAEIHIYAGFYLLLVNVSSILMFKIKLILILDGGDNDLIAP